MSPLNARWLTSRRIHKLRIGLDEQLFNLILDVPGEESGEEFVVDLDLADLLDQRGSCLLMLQKGGESGHHQFGEVLVIDATLEVLHEFQRFVEEKLALHQTRYHLVRPFQFARAGGRLAQNLEGTEKGSLKLLGT